MQKALNRSFKFSWRNASILGAAVLTLLGCSETLALRAETPTYQLIANSPFVVKPYLQLGAQSPNAIDKLDLVWFCLNNPADYKVQFKKKGQELFQEAVKPGQTLVQAGRPVQQLLRYSVTLKGLVPGENFDYQVLQKDKVVFQAQGQAPRSCNQPSRIAIFGDCGINSSGQKKVARECFKTEPNLLIVPGDIAYQHGLIHNYLANYFPIYNADNDADPSVGVPLLRSIPSAAAMGNHDIALSRQQVSLDRFPDALGYYFFFQQPLNGFQLLPDKANAPQLAGTAQSITAYKKALGKAFPRMANYSFNYGNAHFTVLDGNIYMNWNDPRLVKWLENDLQQAKKAQWKFIVMHQPAFTIDSAHAGEQQTRLILNVIEKKGVDVVFAGHSHCYERTRPIYLKPEAGKTMLTRESDGTVNGQMQIDNVFDGVANTKPKGVIHIVSGAGGAKLYSKGFYQPDADKDYMLKYDSNQHSFTTLDLNDKKATIKQITEDGQLLDQLVITK